MRYKKDAPISIVIADDHDVYRDGLQLLLAREKTIQVLGQACNGKELIGIVKERQPDMVITDLRMPVLDGVGAVQQLSVLYPFIRSIALSVFDDEDLVIKVLEAGALGYVIKNAERGEIIDAIRTVHTGEPYYCLSTSTQFAKKISESSFNPYKLHTRAAFNEQEKKIIGLICEERSNKEIAAWLYMNTRTVERIRAMILDKMNVKTSAGIAIYAMKNELYPV
jgi:DNA-binding NarL/FixJ family response regulator